MSTNCIRCVVNPRTGTDLLCDRCRDVRSTGLRILELGRAQTARERAGLTPAKYDEAPPSESTQLLVKHIPPPDPVRRYWLSWHQPTDDHRPLTDPPHPQVLGWWKSGYDAEDTPILCGLVEAATEDEAKTYVGLSWPEAERWRFIDEVTEDWRPSNRFVLKPWMIERMAG